MVSAHLHGLAGPSGPPPSNRGKRRIEASLVSPAGEAGGKKNQTSKADSTEASVGAGVEMLSAQLNGLVGSSEPPPCGYDKHQARPVLTGW